ncbi:MAG: PTS ascorbate transporter subunit IIC, partial [Firmicutes bacterium]|nr:PTS ascorbate transporter subunit IIC [Bacillota bacterium]
MEILKAVLHFVIFQVLDQAPVLLGLIALIGLVAQRRSFEEIVEGTAKTVVGVLILFAGAGVLLNATFPVTDMLNKAFGVQGVIPSDEGAFALAMGKLSTQIVSAFVLGFFIHVFLVIVTPVMSMKNLYLTGHMMLYFSTVSTLSWMWVGLSGTALVVASGITCALFWTLAPWWTFRYSRQFVGDDFTLGHHQHVVAWVGAVVGPLVGRKEEDAEKLQLPKLLGMFNDFVIVMAVTMPVIFLIIGIFAGPAVVAKASGNQNWAIWLIIQGLQFAAGIGIIMMGVRMFLSALIPAFKGISDRIIPGVRPALDCPVFYPYSPMGAILGFLSALAGATVTTLLLMVMGSSVILFDGR